jgi:hypothetical protein
MSAMTTLPCGFPRGSVLGPILYVLYIAEIFSTVTACGANVHSYADDIQLYAGGPAATTVEISAGFAACTKQIDDWVQAN